MSIIDALYVSPAKRRKGWSHSEPLSSRLATIARAVLIRAYLWPNEYSEDMETGERLCLRRSAAYRLLMASVGPSRTVVTPERLPGETDKAHRRRAATAMYAQFCMEQGDDESDADFFARAEAEREESQREWLAEAEHVLTAFGEDDVECGEIVLSRGTMDSVAHQQIVTPYEHDDENYLYSYPLTREQAERIALIEGKPLPDGVAHSLQCVRREPA